MATIVPVSEISLNGGEISILKTLGLSGASMGGEQLAERMDDMETAEFLDTLEGLMSLDYVTSNKVNIRTMDDVQKASFRVNPAQARDLKDAVYPSRKKPETDGADDAPEFSSERKFAPERFAEVLAVACGRS